MFGILEAIAIPRAGVYHSYRDLIENLNERMEKEGYRIVKARSHRSRMGGADVPNNDIIRCDLHNHEPGTPEPASPEQSDGEQETVEESSGELPALGPDNSSALQVAGISETSLQLTGDTFNQFKAEYRKLSLSDRMQTLSNLQVRIAAIYAIQNEDAQRQRRHESNEHLHDEAASGKRPRQSLSKPQKRQRQSIAEDPSSGQETVQDQLHTDGHLLDQELMDATQFQLDHAVAQTPVAVPQIEMTQFQQFENASKRGRGPNP
ncbi:WD domain-containing protein [Cordyceps javanica]|uniref:WD domain-containing protein n=1 Tax=Cordyceps javanica TaxID=43265 RepID=A0A545VGY7_9HYPO|nr:WD domain-containing protein [Cordyceps javanica]TQW12073.1 WD domain-containing protein [Cordyceps javanica]